MTANIKNAKSLRELFELTATWHAFQPHSLISVLEFIGRTTSNVLHFGYDGCANNNNTNARNNDWQREYKDRLVVEQTREIISSGVFWYTWKRVGVNITHGVAKCGVGASNDGDELVKALAKAIERHLAECNGQEIANIAWAFAKSGYFDEGMFANLAEMAEKQMDRFNSQEITNIFWAFATAECHNANFFKALARAIECQLHNFQHAGIIKHGVGISKGWVLQTLLCSERLGRRPRSVWIVSTRKISRICVGRLQKAGQYDAELFTTLGKTRRATHGKLERTQGLSNSVWSVKKPDI